MDTDHLFSVSAYPCSSVISVAQLNTNQNYHFEVRVGLAIEITWESAFCFMTNKMFAWCRHLLSPSAFNVKFLLWQIMAARFAGCCK